MMLKMAVLLPTPIANARTASALRPGSRAKPRRLCRTSRRKPCIRTDYTTDVKQPSRRIPPPVARCVSIGRDHPISQAVVADEEALQAVVPEDCVQDEGPRREKGNLLSFDPCFAGDSACAVTKKPPRNPLQVGKRDRRARIPMELLDPVSGATHGHRSRGPWRGGERSQRTGKAQRQPCPFQGTGRIAFELTVQHGRSNAHGHARAPSPARSQRDLGGSPSPVDEHLRTCRFELGGRPEKGQSRLGVRGEDAHGHAELACELARRRETIPGGAKGSGRGNEHVLDTGLASDTDLMLHDFPYPAQLLGTDAAVPLHFAPKLEQLAF